MTNLDERYGRKKGNRRSVIALAASLVVVFLGWAIWVNFTPKQAATAVVTFANAISDTEIRAHVRVSKEYTVCSFKAMSEGYAIVGYKTVESDATEYDISIRTTSQALDILVDVCSVK